MKVQRLAPLLVVAAGLLVYQNSFTSPFIYDDAQSILENPTIRQLWPIWMPLSPPHQRGLTVEGRPLINLSLAINYALGGFNVWGYHALNLTVHILAGLALLGIVRRTLRQPRLRERFGAAADGVGLAAAILWTVHPLQTESVTYIVQRAESIMGLFYLLTLYGFIRGADAGTTRPLWYSLAVTTCACGMASKEVMVSAPLMVLLYDRAFLSATFREALRRRWPLYLGLAATWIILGCLLPVNFGNTLTNAERHRVAWWMYLTTEPSVILHYLRLSVWPHPLCFDYDGWPLPGIGRGILLPGLAVVALIAATAWAWKSNSPWGFLGAWFFLILAPSSSVIPLDSAAYEHRMYLPLAAVIVAVAAGGYAFASRRWRTPPQAWKLKGWAASLALIVPLSMLTIQRNRNYRSALAIWQDTAHKRPYNYRAHFNLAAALERAGEIHEALGHYQQAIVFDPDFAEAHYNLAVLLARLGRVTEAIPQYEQAVRLQPDFVEAHCNLGTALDQLGRPQEAIDQYEQALRLMPNSAELQYNLGAALEEVGRVPDAVAHYELALRIKPDFPEARQRLAHLRTVP